VSYRNTTQPQSNPQARFLNRSVETCPSYLTGSKRTKWLNTGEKARKNEQLLVNSEPFHWSSSYYDSPIHIHHRTPENVVQSIISKIRHIHMFTIDTESDRPTQQNPTPIPALLQIQAIHHEKLAAVLLIEVQHLPDPSSSLFRLIQNLCYTIFSPDNKIMAWGEIIPELKSFTQFNLFNISHITDTCNIQEYFMSEWNKQHPHTPACLQQHQLLSEDSIAEDYLICVINTDDLTLYGRVLPKGNNFAVGGYGIF
jgi:hypothetical protein